MEYLGQAGLNFYDLQLGGGAQYKLRVHRDAAQRIGADIEQIVDAQAV